MSIGTLIVIAIIFIAGEAIECNPGAFTAWLKGQRPGPEPRTLPPPAPMGSGGIIASARVSTTWNTNHYVIGRGAAVYIDDEFVGIATGWEGATEC